MLYGLKRETSIADDMLVWGNTIDEHDKTLQQQLQRCKDVCVRPNHEKFQYKQNKVNFYGHVLTDNGLQADASKSDAIVKMTPPRDIKELECFLDLVNVYGQISTIVTQCVSTFDHLSKECIEYM